MVPKEKKGRPLSIQDKTGEEEISVGDHGLRNTVAHLLEVRNPVVQGRGSKRLRGRNGRTKKVCDSLNMINQRGREKERVASWELGRWVG